MNVLPQTQFEIQLERWYSYRIIGCNTIGFAQGKDLGKSLHETNRKTIEVISKPYYTTVPKYDLVTFHERCQQKGSGYFHYSTKHGKMQQLTDSEVEMLIPPANKALSLLQGMEQRMPPLLGVKLTGEQLVDYMAGKTIYLEGMTDGKNMFNAYVRKSPHASDKGLPQFSGTDEFSSLKHQISVAKYNAIMKEGKTLKNVKLSDGTTTNIRKSPVTGKLERSHNGIFESEKPTSAKKEKKQNKIG
jgi:hypothetical protein